VNDHAEEWKIRPENSEDHPIVDALYEAAFESRVEADLVALLRRDCSEHLALVAESEEGVVGHILFTPMLITQGQIGGAVLAQGLGLGPMGVFPAFQNQGIGSQLVRAGLELCEQHGVSFVAVLGHPEYYPRFGFEPASQHGIRCQWDGVPDEVFRVKILDLSSMPPQGGTAYYRDEFDQAT